MTLYFSPSFASFYNDAVVLKINMPKDVVVISQQIWNAMQQAIASGMTIKAGPNNQPMAIEPASQPMPQLSLAQVEAQYAAALTKAINDLAVSWQYDNITSAATYLHSSIPQFAAEAATLVGYRDYAWAQAQALLTKVQAGQTKIPPTVEAFLAIVLPPAPTRPIA
jgi:hypothetical protein